MMSHKTVGKIQNSQIFNESSSQTPIIGFKEHGMNHVEGGWPKEMDLNEASQVNRYLVKILNNKRFR